MDDLVQRQTHRLLTTIPSLLLLYLKYRQDEAVCSAVWHQVLETVARYPEDVGSTLPVLLDAAEHNLLPTYLHSEGELDEAAGSLLTDLLSGSTSSAHTSLARRLLGSSSTHPFSWCPIIC